MLEAVFSMLPMQLKNSLVVSVKGLGAKTN
jgi:hypothetical protein